MAPTEAARLKEIHKNRLVPHEVLHPRPLHSHPFYPLPIVGCPNCNEAHCPLGISISRLQAGRRRTLRPSRAPTGDDMMQYDATAIPCLDLLKALEKNK